MRPLSKLFYKINKNGCWIWQRSKTSNGYGYYKGTSAHRFYYEKYKGKIPKGMYVLHKCDNRNCVNPAHLFLGNQKDNIQDALKKGRLPRGEKHHKSKLNWGQVLKIRQLYFNRICSQYELAKMFHVTQGAIGAIIRRVNWKNI